MSAGHPNTPTPAVKQAIFADLLQQGIAALHIDARRAGVEVPDNLRGRPWLVLNYSYRYHIDDFRFDDSQVFASLSFAGARFPCRVPWDAVFAISDERREEVRVWPEDMPLELRAALTADSGDKEVRGPLSRAPAEGVKGPGLRVIEGAGPTKPTPKKRGHLQRVK